MTSSGSPYARFRRALQRGNLTLVRAAAAELPQIELGDALAICVLMATEDERRYDRAATRWLARFSLERPEVGLDELRSALVALEALPWNPRAARQVLAEICEAHRLPDAARMLLAPAPR